MINRDALVSIIQKGVLAPSGDNMQPWKFVLHESSIDFFLDPLVRVPFWDTAFRAPYIACGAVIENMRIAAETVGYAVRVMYFPDVNDPFWIAHFEFSSGEAKPHPLFESLSARCTNRKMYFPKQEIPADVYAQLDQIFKTFPMFRLNWVKKTEPQFATFAKLMQKVDRMRCETQAAHMALVKGFRLSQKVVDETRDGLDFQTLEIGPGSDMFLRLISSWDRLNTLNHVGVSRMLGFYANLQMNSSQASGLLVGDGQEPVDYVRAGELIERVWLTAAKHGLSFQPMMTLPIFITNWIFNERRFFSEHQSLEIRQMREQLISIFNLNIKDNLMFLFRIGYAPKPSARSLRRDVNTFLLTERPKYEQQSSGI